jgi:DNA-binding NtrC family response regulator
MEPSLDVLVIDDEVDFTEIVCQTLIEHGLHCKAINDPDRTFEILENDPPSLILTDFLMPHMNGLQLMEQLKKRNMPFCVALVTGHSDNDKLLKAMQLGALDYIQKPLHLEDFVNRLNVLVELGRRIAEVRREHPGTEKWEVGNRMIELFKLKLANPQSSAG